MYVYVCVCVCHRWLDELIIALWHDLQAYMEWKAQDSDLQESVGNTLAGLVLGLPNAKSTEHTGEPAYVTPACT